ncbi:MAG: hypothetical protein ABW131_05735 [Candidatus Sedimenticola sp. 6PFRAG5]
MATTVTEAFNIFQKDHVNLDPEVTKQARSSHGWLIGVINGFDGNVDHFPTLYTEKHISFGSFARNTKIRPLDDIDKIICLHAEGSTYQESIFSTTITVNNTSSPLYRLTHDNSDQLNSIRVVNKFVSALSSVPQYDKADVNRNQEAATLKLKSYPWNFDIVPGFYTSPEADGRSYYLIPDGSGHWKKTDPTRDRDLVTYLNVRNEGHMLNLIRVVKYWNKRPTMPSMKSYLLECIMLDYIYSLPEKSISQFVDLHLSDVFRAISDKVLGAVNDPKGIQGDINDLSYEDRFKIRDRALEDVQKADLARAYEDAKEIRNSINTWKRVFGQNFPDYG